MAIARKAAVPAAKTAPSMPVKKTKRRRLSADALERMRQAQIKRWAAARESTQPNLNATVSPIPGAKKKGAKVP